VGSAQLIGVRHLRSQAAPVIDELSILPIGKQTILEESIDSFCGRQRKNILVALEAVPGPEMS